MAVTLVNCFIILNIFIISLFKIFLPTFNLEWFFLDLANYYNKNNSLIDLNVYKQYQANTSFYSFIISFLKLKNFISEAHYIRLLNIVTLPFLIFSFKYIIDYYSKNIFNEKINNSSTVILYIVFTPIIFLMIGKTFPDYLSFFLGIVGYVFFLKRNLILFIFFSIAAILKPLILYIVPLFFIIDYIAEKKIINLKLIFAVIFSLMATFIYIYVIDGFIFSNAHKNYDFHISKILRYLSNYLIYISYLSSLLVFIIPYKIYLFFKEKNNYKIYLLIVSFILINLINFNYGEMNYGFISYIFQGNLINNIILFITVFFYLIFIMEIFTKGKKNYKFYFLAFNIALIILSIFVERPAQRYLIYIYPMFFILIFFYYKDNFFKKIMILNILFFSGINIMQFFYYKNFSLVADQIYIDLKKNKILNLTYPLDIYHINGYKFNKKIIFGENKQYLYTVSYCNFDNKKNVKDKFYSIKIMSYTIKKLCIIEKNDNS